MRTLAVALALTVAPPALAAPTWPSGAKATDFSGFCSWRGTACGARHEHVTGGSSTSGTFAGMVQSAQGWVGTEIKSGPPHFVVSFALLPGANKGQFSQCASGQFDASWKSIALALKSAAGTAHTVHAQLGYEAAIGSSSHPWGVDTAAQVPTYKSCWQRVATVMRANFPGGQLKLVWNNARKFGTTAWTIQDMDPGVEDEYGLMGYDNASWATLSGDFNTWMAIAKGKGKKLGFSEWGEWKNGDDPAYISSMYNYLSANSANIAFDTYQNTSPHTLYPTSSTSWPQSAARYQSAF